MSPEPSIREFDVDVPYAAPEHAITVPLGWDIVVYDVTCS